MSHQRSSSTLASLNCLYHARRANVLHVRCIQAQGDEGDHVDTDLIVPWQETRDETPHLANRGYLPACVRARSLESRQYCWYREEVFFDQDPDARPRLRYHLVSHTDQTRCVPMPASH